MKKSILFILSIWMLFFVYGCSAAHDGVVVTNIYDNLYFDLYDFTFTVDESDDIFYPLHDPLNDFILLKQHISDESDSLTNDEVLLYQHLLGHMIEISEKTDDHLVNLFSHDSTEINTIMTGLGLTVTLDDIVIYNELKLFVETALAENQSYWISKISYIQLKLSISLSSTEVEDLALLQQAYTEIHARTGTFDLYEQTADDMLSLLASYGYSYSEDEATSIQNAYLIILQLVD